MRGDAIFGNLVHLAGPDLQLDALLAWPDHGGVDRAVVILLGGRDVVLEAAGHDRPGGVDDAQRVVALGQALHDNAEPDDVGELLEADRLALHLAPDRVGALAPAADLGGDTAIGKLPGELQLDVGDETGAARFQLLEPLANDPVGIWIELAERQVLELLAHLM